MFRCGTQTAPKPLWTMEGLTSRAGAAATETRRRKGTSSGRNRKGARAAGSRGRTRSTRRSALRRREKCMPRSTPCRGCGSKARGYIGLAANKPSAPSRPRGPHPARAAASRSALAAAARRSAPSVLARWQEARQGASHSPLSFPALVQLRPRIHCPRIHCAMWMRCSRSRAFTPLSEHAAQSRVVAAQSRIQVQCSSTAANAETAARVCRILSNLTRPAEAVQPVQPMQSARRRGAELGALAWRGA